MHHYTGDGKKKFLKNFLGEENYYIFYFQFTYTIMQKELKVCKSAEELKANEKVKKKASDYVSKYMKKYDREYKRSPNQAD